MKDLSAGLLDIKIEEKENNITMFWLGECININPTTVLNPYFDELISDLTSDKEFEINFSNLQYMKSSTVPHLVKLITKLNKQKIKTKILYNTFSNWQTATFKALLSVVSIMDFVEVIGIEVKEVK